MKAAWLAYSILSLFCWGLWGFFTKLATNEIRPYTALVYQLAGSTAVYVIGLLALRIKLEANPRGIAFAVLSGLVGTLGFFFFMSAMSRYKASVVVTLTALYPLITVLLSFAVLREAITLKQAAGIFFALLAVIFFSM